MSANIAKTLRLDDLPLIEAEVIYEPEPTAPSRTPAWRGQCPKTAWAELRQELRDRGALTEDEDARWNDPDAPGLPALLRAWHNARRAAPPVSPVAFKT